MNFELIYDSSNRKRSHLRALWLLSEDLRRYQLWTSSSLQLLSLFLGTISSGRIVAKKRSPCKRWRTESHRFQNLSVHSCNGPYHRALTGSHEDLCQAQTDQPTTKHTGRELDINRTRLRIDAARTFGHCCRCSSRRGMEKIYNSIFMFTMWYSTDTKRSYSSLQVQNPAKR